MEFFCLKVTMFDVIICHLLDLFAKKKILINLSYLFGTTIFILLSYNTAHQLSVIPVTISSSSSSKISIQRNISITINLNRRKEYLDNRCRSPRSSSRSLLTNIIHRSHLINHLGFLLRSHSLFYCSVPKVATRTFLLFLTYLHIRDELMKNFTTKLTYRLDDLRPFVSTSPQTSELLLNSFLNSLRSQTEINSTEIDLWKLHQNGVFPSIRLRTLKNPSILFSSSFQRVIFVRHPFERLASAYVDKISRIQSEPFSLYDEIRRSICRKYSSTYLTIDEQRLYQENLQLKTQFNEPCAKKIPTFEHFLDYLISDSIQNDVHWQPYSSLCRVCLFKYNFIGKYETLVDDYSHLLSRLDLNLTEWIRINRFSTGRTKQSYQSMFTNLSDRTFCFLKEFYRDDLQNFQYEIDEYFPQRRSTNCSNERFPHFSRHLL